MLRLPEFEYLAPPDLEGAIRILSEHGPSARVMGGGTDLVPNLKRRQFPAPVVVSLRRVHGLRGISGTPEEGMVIGSLTPLEEVAGHPLIRQHYTALAEAAGAVATPAIRSRATLGGNLLVDTRCNYYNQTEPWREALGWCMKAQGDVCRVAPSSPRCLAVSSSDTAPALIALGARVRLAGPGGTREIPLSDLYRDDGIHYLNKAPEEILTEIALPPAGHSRSAYLKLRRRGSFDFPLLGVAAWVQRDGSGTVTEARVVLGAVASRPLEVREAAQLAGQPLSPEGIAAVARAAERIAKPMDNADLTTPYRKRVTRVFTARALERCT